MKFILGVLAVAGVAALAFVGFGTVAMSNYGATHDMSIDVPLEEVLLLDPMTSFTELCEGERHESWDSVCNAPAAGMEKIEDIREWALERLDYSPK